MGTIFLLQLVMAFSEDMDQLIHEVKINSVKIRADIQKFESSHTKKCEQIVNRLRYMADAEALNNRVQEQETKMQSLAAYFEEHRSMSNDGKLNRLNRIHQEIMEKYHPLSKNYRECLSKWPDESKRRKVAVDTEASEF